MLTAESLQYVGIPRHWLFQLNSDNSTTAYLDLHYDIKHMLIIMLKTIISFMKHKLRKLINCMMSWMLYLLWQHTVCKIYTKNTCKIYTLWAHHNAILAPCVLYEASLPGCQSCPSPPSSMSVLPVAPLLHVVLGFVRQQVGGHDVQQGVDLFLRQPLLALLHDQLHLHCRPRTQVQQLQLLGPRQLEWLQRLHERRDHVWGLFCTCSVFKILNYFIWHCCEVCVLLFLFVLPFL